MYVVGTFRGSTLGMALVESMNFRSTPSPTITSYQLELLMPLYLTVACQRLAAYAWSVGTRVVFVVMPTRC
jgi:hypothetical protein